MLGFNHSHPSWKFQTCRLSLSQHELGDVKTGPQKSSGYNQRSRVETHIGRWKTVIGPKLKARNFENQKTEAKIGVRILNRMTELGRPKFERTA